LVAVAQTNTNAPPHGPQTGEDGGSIKSVVSIVASIAAIITGFFTWSENRAKRAAEKEAKEKTEALADVREGITAPIKLTVGEYRNSIMVLGIGGSGKTSVIQCLFQDRNANPKEETEDFKFFQRRIQVTNIPGVNNQVWLNLFACDYRGQDLSTLTRTFVKQQLELYSPMAYGHIHSLILVVDLRKPKPTKDGPDVPVSKEPDKGRIDKHLTEWNQTALDAIAGLLTAETKYVCLFINKLDRLEDQTDEAKIRYALRFEELRLRLVERFTPKPELKLPPPRFDVIIGKAETGDGYNQLSNGIAFSSLRVNK
jgi:hypothetical protein